MGVEVVEQVPASRKLGRERAVELIEGAATVHIAKGRKLDEFAGGEAKPEIVTKMLGSTGNLRAPTIVYGDRLIVGYNEDLYRAVFSQAE